MAILKDLIVQGATRLIGDTNAAKVTGTSFVKSGGTSSQFLKADGSVDSNTYATQTWVNNKGYTTNTGTVTSVAMTVPTGLSISGSPITTSGTLALSLTSGYSIPTTTKQGQWDTAYTNNHTHSSLTLSTTAQAYDGTHTLALPSSDPYSSARTPSAHASTGTGYGVGTTSNYGHVKLATGDMNGASAADGVACGKNHTHSQYYLATNPDAYVKGSEIGTAATHAHSDYVTGISWDSTNNKLAWSKGGTAQTAITIGYATSAGSATSATSATTASKLSTNAGSATNPVYFTGGVPTACTYSLNKTVPSDAVFTDTNTKVTSAANHYTPSRDTSADKSASATGATAAWSIDVVKGVTLQTDGKGHVTGITVTSGKIPGNPNTDTKVTQTVTTSSNTSWRPLIIGQSYSDAATFAPSTVTDTVLATHLAKYAPSTGILAIVGFNQMGTNGQVVAGNNKKLFNTNGGVTTIGAVATSNSYNDLDDKPTIPTVPTFSSLTLSTTAQKYDGTHTLALPSSDPYTSARTPASHTHGNIQNGGTLQTNDITIANGDKLVVTDSSDSSKVARTSISFDGSTATKCLTQKGTWESFTNNAGTVTKVSTGTGLTGGDITTTGTISINSTYQGYISNGNTAYGWGNHANQGYAKSVLTHTSSSNVTSYTGRATAYGTYDDIWVGNALYSNQMSFILPYDPDYDHIIHYTRIENTKSAALTVIFTGAGGAQNIIASSTSFVIPAGKSVEVSYMYDGNKYIITWSGILSSLTTT